MSSPTRRRLTPLIASIIAVGCLLAAAPSALAAVSDDVLFHEYSPVVTGALTNSASGVTVNVVVTRPATTAPPIFSGHTTTSGGSWSLNLGGHGVTPLDAITISYSGAGAPGEQTYQPFATTEASLSATHAVVPDPGPAAGPAAYSSVLTQRTAAGGAITTQTASYADQRWTTTATYAATDDVQVQTIQAVGDSLVAASFPAPFVDQPVPVECDADYVTRNVSCSNVPSGSYALVQKHGSTTLATTALSPCSAGCSTTAATMKAGDSFALHLGSASGRVLTTLTLPVLRTDEDDDGVSVTCAPGHLLTNLLDFAGVCSPDGTAGVPTEDDALATFDDLSPGLVSVVPLRVSRTSPLDGESVAGNFLAFASGTSGSNRAALTLPITLTITGRGVNKSFGNANSDAGLPVNGLAPGRYTATWAAVDGHGDTASHVSQIIEQAATSGPTGPTGSGTPGANGSNGANGTNGTNGAAGAAGAAGPQGGAGADGVATPGVPGTPGAVGAPGPAGPPGADGKSPPAPTVTCTSSKIVRKKVRVTCKVVAAPAAKARHLLQVSVRRGRTVYASRTALAASRIALSSRRLHRGTYTLRIKLDGAKATTTTIRVR